MRKTFLLIVGCLAALALASGAVWAQTGSNMMGQQQQGQMPYGPGPGMMGPGYGGGYGMMGPGMMGPGYGGGYGMMGPGMMGPGYGGGYGMMGPGMMMGGGGMMGGGMMGMMMNHMMGGGYGMMGMGGMGMGYMLRYLDLSAEQWKKVRALAAERLDKMNDLMAKMGKLRLELWGQSGQAKPDAAKVKKLFAQMAELHADLYLTGIDYLQKVKGVLTKKQIERMENWRY